MSRTREDLMDAAIQVSNAGDGENTKERIGGILYDISEHIGEGGGGGGDPLNHPLSDINNTFTSNPDGENKILVWNGEAWEYQIKPSGGGGSGDSISISPATFTDGVTVAEYEINGEQSMIKAPNVTVTQVQTSGTKIATISINGSETQLYAPSGGSGGATSLNDLSDVTITSPQRGQILKYIGSSNWINEDLDIELVKTYYGNEALIDTELSQLFKIMAEKRRNKAILCHITGVEGARDYTVCIHIELLYSGNNYETYRIYKVSGFITSNPAEDLYLMVSVGRSANDYSEYIVKANTSDPSAPSIYPIVEVSKKL